MIRTQDGDVVETGGLVRVQHGAPSAADQSGTSPQWEASRVSTGPLRMTIGSGEVVSAGVSRYQAGADLPTNSGVMATAQRNAGKVTVQLVPGDESSRTLVETAVREGLVRETSPGFFEDIERNDASAESAQKEEQKPSEQPFAFFEGREMEDWNADVEPLSQPSFEQAIAGVIASVQRGSDDFTGVGRMLAEANGFDPAVGEDYAKSGYEFYRKGLTRDLVKQGHVTEANVGEFYESIMGHRDLARAMQEMAFEGKTETFRRLAAYWGVQKASLIR
jgi:hypothetical protein